MSHHKHVHSGTFLLLHLIALLLLAFSLGLFKENIFWYKMEGNGYLSFMKIQLGGKQSCSTLGCYDTSDDTHAFINKNNLSETKKIVLESYYLAIGGMACSAVVIASIVLQYVLKKCLPKFLKRLLFMLTIAFSVFAVILDFLAFGIFFRIQSALKEDGFCPILQDICNKFSGKTSVAHWGPDDGFWLCLAAAICAGIAFIMSLRGGKHHKYSRLR